MSTASRGFLGGRSRPRKATKRIANATCAVLAVAIFVLLNGRPGLATEPEAGDSKASAPVKDVLSLKAAVVETRHTEKRPLTITCEVENDSRVPLRILATPVAVKIRENEVIARTVNETLKQNSNGKPVELAVYVESVYPRYRELRGIAATGRQKRAYFECPPGKTIRVKMELAAGLFEPGDCKLFVALRSSHAGTKNVAVAKPVSIEVISTDQDRDAAGTGDKHPRRAPDTRPSD